MNKQSVNTYYYSYDGTSFTQFGGTFALAWGGYRGDYIGMYNYNNAADSGYVDVDWFHYSFAGPTITQVAAKPPKTNYSAYSDKNGSILCLAGGNGGSIIRLPGNPRSGGRVTLVRCPGKNNPVYP